MDNPSEEALAHFMKGSNCAQALLVTFAPPLGLPEQQAMEIASLFGGGMARRGMTCGAVTGGLMALGLKLGHPSPAGKDEAYAAAREFMRRFEERHGSLTCRDLISFDISDPEQREKARNAGVFNEICPALVRDAAEIIQSMLREESAKNADE